MSEELTILIIEDNPDNRELLMRMLERSGYAVIPASNAEEAFKVLQVMVIHAMLVDINLPGKSGIEFLEEVRKSEQFKDIPAIAITANTVNGAGNLYENAGFMSCLSKPVSRHDLTEAITKIFQ